MEELQKKIQELIKNVSKDDFVFDLLSIYGNTNTTIKRLRDGDKNKLAEKGELELRSKLFFKVVQSDLYSTIDDVKNKLKGKRTDPRFVIVTDYETLLAYDTKTKDTLDIKISELDKKYNFFLPWKGMEKTEYLDENIADVKAAQDLAKLYDEIIKTNPHKTEDEIHDLNIFLSRLLFCYFAEDTDIFEKNQFTHTLGSHTNDNGEDTKNLLETIFTIFNQKESERKKDLPDYLSDFPYVNGKLFAEQYPIPGFTTKSRRILIEMGGLDWSQINPDIFGSMMQAVVSSDDRSSFGMHYTSVPNIMKLIKPLFLDELREEFENSVGNTKKLQELKVRLSKIKFFDPACGSGNFLIIAYKEIKKLEIEIIKELDSLALSDIKLSQFYGIEIDNFACETAKLSMYLAEHQMNVVFLEEIGLRIEPLPLKDGGNITQGNAARIDWEIACPKEDGDEIYVIGNPPYKGFSQQTPSQKSDIKYILGSTSKLDYISIFFIKGGEYINNSNSSLGFVTTNSISQGEQVHLLWPSVLKNNIEILFAYQSFKWTNNAKGSAGVSVTIIGLTSNGSKNKYIFTELTKKEVSYINPYLTESKVFTVPKRKKPISDLPEMVLGNMPNDWGHLHFTVTEKDEIIRQYPHSIKFFRRIKGSQEFIKGVERWCLWIEESEHEMASGIEPILKRLESVTEERSKSKKTSYNKFASRPYRFIEIRHRDLDAILVPGTSSEKRKYIPMGFIHPDTIINNLAFAVYGPEIYQFGILSSLMHNIWVKAVGGSLETRIRYSSVLCYNTFPFPEITEKQKYEITEYVHDVLDERSKYSEKTMAQMYDPEKMPKGLKNAHHQLDLAIEKIYRSKPFENDEERLEYLFKLYEKMIAKEQEIISNKKK